MRIKQRATLSFFPSCTLFFLFFFSAFLSLVVYNSQGAAFRQIKGLREEAEKRGKQIIRDVSPPVGRRAIE